MYRHLMVDGLRLTSAFLVYTSIALYIFLVTADAGSVNGRWVYYLAFFESVRLFFSRREDPLDISMGTIFILLFGIAGPGVYWLEGRDTTLYVASMIMFKDAFRVVHKGSYVKAVTARTNSDRNILVSIPIIVLLLSLALASNVIFDGVIAKLGFIAPFAVSVVYFERYLRKASKPDHRALICLAIYLFTIGIYTTLFWSGFGRI